MTKQEIIEQIRKKGSFLCIGLDTDITKIPTHLLKLDDPIFEFNRQIIDQTHDLCIAYKPNLAFYESLGAKGFVSLEKTIGYLNSNFPEIFTIADAKRGDIGNTSEMYAKTFFREMNFDAVTVAPYMGEDSVIPFLKFPNKWVILLALTSNKGAFDFQTLTFQNKKLYEHVLKTSIKWATDEQLMFVVGATKAEMLSEIRKLIPSHFLLVPGIGVQGGSLQDVARYGMTRDCGLIVNSSRAIIYAGNGLDFAQKAREEAMIVQKEMKLILKNGGIQQ